MAAPGLRVLAVHQPFSHGELNQKFRDAQRQLFLQENCVPSGWELGALPVVRQCVSTGLAASEFEDGQWLSAESAAKRSAAKQAKSDIKSRYPTALAGGLEFPDELDELTASDEGASQIAIVHADGNGIGQILQRILDTETDDESLISRYEAVSHGISTLAQEAFRETLLDLTAAVRKLEDYGISPPDKYYPLRPIVGGGDDLTFVCHGRLGLALAVRYLKHFEQQSKKHLQGLGEREPLTACAGVMIVPGKFPFSRACHLAEELTTNAKRARKRAKQGGSWVDFQVVMEGIHSTIAQSREDWYQQGERWLIRRPYCIGLKGDVGWEAFESNWREFSSERWPRSRAKRLMEVLAQGEEATKELMAEWESRSLKLADPWRVAMEERQVTRMRTPYFDPLEMLDSHIDSALFERGLA